MSDEEEQELEQVPDLKYAAEDDENNLPYDLKENFDDSGEDSDDSAKDKVIIKKQDIDMIQKQKDDEKKIQKNQKEIQKKDLEDSSKKSSNINNQNCQSDQNLVSNNEESFVQIVTNPGRVQNRFVTGQNQLQDEDSYQEYQKPQKDLRNNNNKQYRGNNQKSQRNNREKTNNQDSFQSDQSEMLSGNILSKSILEDNDSFLPPKNQQAQRPQNQNVMQNPNINIHEQRQQFNQISYMMEKDIIKKEIPKEKQRNLKYLDLFQQIQINDTNLIICYGDLVNVEAESCFIPVSYIQQDQKNKMIENGLTKYFKNQLEDSEFVYEKLKEGNYVEIISFKVNLDKMQDIFCFKCPSFIEKNSDQSFQKLKKIIQLLLCEAQNSCSSICIPLLITPQSNFNLSDAIKISFATVTEFLENSIKEKKNNTSISTIYFCAYDKIEFGYLRNCFNTYVDDIIDQNRVGRFQKDISQSLKPGY